MGFKCFHCGKENVYWQNDNDYEEYGYEGEGLVQTYTCPDCGAEIEYRIPSSPESED